MLEGTVACPYCGGEIDAEAKLCNHCKRPLEARRDDRPVLQAVNLPAAVAAVNVRGDLGRKLRFAGLWLLVSSTLVYMLAVDRAWYAVSGITRVTAESYGLLRWRFVSHALGLSNGGMREESWAFWAFPIMFWLGLALVLVGTVLVWRGPATDPRHQAFGRLRGRQAATIEERQRSFRNLKALLLLAGLAAIAAIGVLGSAPLAESIKEPQLKAAGWRIRLDEMRDDQLLMVGETINGVGWGNVVTADEANAFLREEAADNARRAQASSGRCDNARNRGECQMMRAAERSLDTKWKAVPKADVANTTAEQEAQWRSALASFDSTTIPGAALCMAFLLLLGVAATKAPRVIGVEFRGLSPAAEDPLYPSYTRFGGGLVVAAALLAILGVAAASGGGPSGIAVALFGATLFGAVTIRHVARVLLAPQAIARSLDPQLAASKAVRVHDRKVLAEIAKLEASSSTIRQYLTTLQSAASPPDLVAKAQSDLQQAQESAAQLRGRLLGSALKTAQSHLAVALVQRRALQTHGAPPEAFHAINAAMQSARAEIARLAEAAGWLPPAPATNESQPALITTMQVIVVALLLSVGVAAVAMFSRPKLASDEERHSAVVAQTSPSPSCDSVLDEYKRALATTRDSADGLINDRCATNGADGTLVPPTPMSPPCETQWAAHFIAAQRTIDLNAKARAACPSMNLESMGTIPPSMRIDPTSVTAAPPSSNNQDEPLTVSGVQDILQKQAAGLTTNNFVSAFAETAVAFFPHMLEPAQGRARIAEAARRSWAHLGSQAQVTVTPGAIGIYEATAWASATWTVKTSTIQLSVRVTEVLEKTDLGTQVVAASFSVAPPQGAKTLEAAGRSDTQKPGPESWLLAPLELAKNLRSDPTTSLFGSDAHETAQGAPAVYAMLSRWRNVKLEFVGSPKVLDDDGHYVVAGVARQRGPKGSTYQVLGVFTPTGPELSYQLVAAHYAVATESANAPTAPAINESDLVGKWTGSATTVAYDPDTKVADKQTKPSSIEIVRRDDRLYFVGRDVAMVLTRGDQGELVDRADEEVSLTSFSFEGAKLKVVTELLGRYGSTTTALYSRVP